MFVAAFDQASSALDGLTPPCMKRFRILEAEDTSVAPTSIRRGHV